MLSFSEIAIHFTGCIVSTRRRGFEILILSFLSNFSAYSETWFDLERQTLRHFQSLHLYLHIRYDLNKMCHVNEEEWCSHWSWHPFRSDNDDGGRVFGMISRNLKMTTAVRQRVLRAFCCAWYSIIDKAFSPPKGTYWKLSSSAQPVSTASRRHQQQQRQQSKIVPREAKLVSGRDFP